MNSITAQELISLIVNKENITIIDVRSNTEYEEIHIEEAKNIPLHILPMKLHEIPRKGKLFFLCRSGGRSAQACHFAQNAGIHASNVLGGMNDLEKYFPQRMIHGERKKLFNIFSSLLSK